jgi:phospholipase C
MWRYISDPSHCAKIDQFVLDAKDGCLPDYAFIEPEIIGYDDSRPNDDQHPVSDIRFGENLINRVYQALLDGPPEQFDRTLLIITYDEHGGIFDHVAPPIAVPPHPRQCAGEDGFTFDRLGVRVPAVLVSPRIQQGTVFHPPQPVDHTAVIKTLCLRWDLPALTQRDATAVDLAQVLGDETRAISDLPRPAFWKDLPPESDDKPLNGLQRDVVRLTAQIHQVPVPELTNVPQAKEFLRSLANR